MIMICLFQIFRSSETSNKIIAIGEQLFENCEIYNLSKLFKFLVYCYHVTKKQQQAYAMEQV